MDRLTSMMVFVRAAELGSFAAAAEAFDISPTMVGKHVRFLEERLGTKLINRTTRRQSLTEIGRDYLDRCRRVIEAAEMADASAEAARGTPRGLLRVTAPVSFGTHKLAPALARYLRLYPEVSVDLVLSDRIVDIIDEGYEIAFRVGPLADSKLLSRSLRPYRLIACASPDYLAERGAPQRPEDLTHHDCIGFAHWEPGERWTFSGPDGSTTVSVKSRYRINNGSALRLAALAGAGIILQSEALLSQDVEQGRLVRVLPEYEPPSRPLSLLWHSDRRPTPKVRTFIDFAVAEFG